MKTFLKMLLATILGGIILIFVGFIIILSFASLADKEVKIADNSILRIDLNNVIKERAQDNPFAGVNPISLVPAEPLGLNNILKALDNAADDEDIIGVYLHGGIPMCGHGSIAEIRQALAEFKKSGKFVYSYSEIMTQKGYLLASASDSLFVNPEGFFEWSGLSTQVTYFKEALAKLGIEPVVLRATDNKYKSAVEPFLRNDMSEENRMQLSELLSSVWGHYLKEISNQRNIDLSQLNALADSMALSSPKNAAENKLIDRVAYEDEVMAIMMNHAGVDERDDLNFVSINKYASTVKLGEGGYSADRVALVIAQGDIQGGDAGEYSIGSERIARAIRDARTNDKVKAIVLRVNSPGGSALASEVIWREVELARQQKPVIASFGDLAASGGYYIACHSDTIVAQPTTITGSIGAFGLFFTGEELLNDKLGINIETVKTNEFADLGTFDDRITPAEKRMLIRQIDEIYSTFTERVAEGRKMPVEQVRELGGGRVYSGSEALELGLVDVLGGVEDAIAIAAAKAGLDDEYRVVEYPKLEDPLKVLIKELTGNYEARLLESHLGSNARYFRLLEKATKMQGLQARMEYDLIIE